MHATKVPGPQQGGLSSGQGKLQADGLPSLPSFCSAPQMASGWVVTLAHSPAADVSGNVSGPGLIVGTASWHCFALSQGMPALPSSARQRGWARLLSRSHLSGVALVLPLSGSGLKGPGSSATSIPPAVEKEPCDVWAHKGSLLAEVDGAPGPTRDHLPEAGHLEPSPSSRDL